MHKASIYLVLWGAGSMAVTAWASGSANRPAVPSQRPVAIRLAQAALDFGVVEDSAANKPPDTSKPFSHNIHLNAEKMNEKLACVDCHNVVNADGVCPKTAVELPEHEACYKCHKQNFYAKKLTICTKCHQSNTIEEENPLRDLPRHQVSPRKAQFNHEQHVKRTSCKTCHKVKRKGKAITRPGHRQCCECHAAGQAQPRMADCAACHAKGRSVHRRKSLIKGFTHSPKNHMRNADGSARGCVQCHKSVKEARYLTGIQTPPMAICMECHDGESAFSADADCFKCHSESIFSHGMPASHPTPKVP